MSQLLGALQGEAPTAQLREKRRYSSTADEFPIRNDLRCLLTGIYKESSSPARVHARDTRTRATKMGDNMTIQNGMKYEE